MLTLADLKTQDKDLIIYFEVSFTVIQIYCKLARQERLAKVLGSRLLRSAHDKMVNQDQGTDPAKALECKEKGNKCFGAGDYHGAEELYTKAINYDPTNPLLYTNRAMALLKLHQFKEVIDDSLHAISLLDHRDTMKAHFQLAQAQIALHRLPEALKNAKIAHELCVEEIHVGGKGGTSIGMITELVLKCKKEDWERRESERLAGRNGLLYELEDALREKKGEELRRLGENGIPDEEGIAKIQNKYEAKLGELRSTFEIANMMSFEDKRRKVPDWVVDDITFSVMLDPVVTKTGQSYDRSSIMEHLKRSQTDPLTREPLRLEDLRPNLALRVACEEYLDQNGWAVDW